MSIPVALSDVGTEAQRFPTAYLLSVDGQAAPRALSAAPQFRDGVFVLGVGLRTAANIAANPRVTLLWPAPAAGSMALLVDGTATVDGQQVSVTPTGAVLHQTVG